MIPGLVICKQVQQRAVGAPHPACRLFSCRKSSECLHLPKGVFNTRTAVQCWHGPLAMLLHCCCYLAGDEFSVKSMHI